MANLTGTRIDRYQIQETIGEGGMAVVYKAYDTRLERDVAIKVIRTDQFGPAVLDRILKRFEREAKALARLSHPNIVKVHDYGERASTPYLVLEYLPAGTLKQRLGKAIPWREAVRLIIPIAQALEYAHEHNIIHRDIKPSNILLTEKGQPMLTDFGIAKLLENEDTATLTGTGLGIGTPEYMSPEQWTGDVSAKSDIYSLGVVLYEMVTGHKPYVADTPAAVLLKQSADQLPSPRIFAPDLPIGIEKVLMKALAKKADDRYAGMIFFVNALENLLAGRSPKLQNTPRAKSLRISAYTQETTQETDETIDELKTINQTRTTDLTSPQLSAPSVKRRPMISEEKSGKEGMDVIQIIGIGIIVLVAIWFIWKFIPKSQSPVPQSGSAAACNLFEAIPIAKQYSQAPPMKIDQIKQYFATFKMEKGGEFVVELYPDKAPITVNNFVFLACKFFFDGVTFHRVLDGFMAQGGDPTGTGSGGPGYEFINENSNLTFDKAGMMAMANGGPDTNGSQFFITYGAQEFLNGGYTIFGQVIKGMEVVNAITRRDPQQNPSFTGDIIETITITEK